MFIDDENRMTSAEFFRRIGVKNPSRNGDNKQVFDSLKSHGLERFLSVYQAPRGIGISIDRIKAEEVINNICNRPTELSANKNIDAYNARDLFDLNREHNRQMYLRINRIEAMLLALMKEFGVKSPFDE